MMNLFLTEKLSVKQDSVSQLSLNQGMSLCMCVHMCVCVGVRGACADAFLWQRKPEEDVRYISLLL